MECDSVSELTKTTIIYIDALWIRSLGGETEALISL